MWGTSCPHLVIPPHRWGQALSTDDVQNLGRCPVLPLLSLWGAAMLQTHGHSATCPERLPRPLPVTESMTGPLNSLWSCFSVDLVGWRVA